MSHRDRTQMGGEDDAFRQTRWSEIRSARTEDPDRRRKAVEKVMSRYWKPVYAYLRRKGLDNERAKDTTQAFFLEVLLGRGLIQKADPNRGRFRTFLLTALDNFVRSQGRKLAAGIRHPEGGLVSLDAMGEAPPSLPAADATPEEAFIHAWAWDLLREAMGEAEAACRQAGQEMHWQVFRRTVVEPAISGGSPPPLSALCRELGIASRTVASNMTTTVKRRFRAVLRAKVRASVGSDAAVDQEIRDLMAILSQTRAGG